MSAWIRSCVYLASGVACCLASYLVLLFPASHDMRAFWLEMGATLVFIYLTVATVVSEL